MWEIFIIIMLWVDAYMCIFFCFIFTIFQIPQFLNKYIKEEQSFNILPTTQYLKHDYVDQ